MKRHEWIESRGKRLSAMVHTPPAMAAGTPVVVFCHGFTGDKVGANQLMLNLAKALEAAGLAAVRFDFAGSGDSEGLFAADTTVAGWRQDLAAVIAWVRRQFAGAPLYVLGHSLGGLVALCETDPAVAGRVALAPVMHPLANFADIILGPENWAKALKGERIANFYNKGFALEAGFVADLVAAGYDPLAATQKYAAPLIVVHGTADLAVPLAGSRELTDAYRGPKELALLACDHVFTGCHEELGAVVVGWLKGL